VAAGQLPQRWTDCHCHLPPLKTIALEGQLGAASGAGVMRLVNVGRDVSSSIEAARVAAREPGVWSTAGIHPDHAATAVDEAGEIDLSAIELVLFEHDVVGVGECGLRYGDGRAPRDAQRALLAAHVALANAYRKVLIVHTDHEWDDLFDVIRGEGVPERVVLSPFTGDAEPARRASDLGMHLSFNGLLRQEEGQQLRDIVARCPLDRIVIEAGSTPVPTNLVSLSPWWLPRIGEVLSRLIGRHLSDTALITWSNARELYGLR
jgi:TatD DNase family protein